LIEKVRMQITGFIEHHKALKMFLACSEILSLFRPLIRRNFYSPLRNYKSLISSYRF